MGKKDVVDAKKINSKFTIIEFVMFVTISIKFLLKNLGCWNIVNGFIIAEQVVLSFYLVWLLIFDIPKYHDSNKTTDKNDYQNSVSLFLQLDLAKIFERVVTLTITNILFFLPPNATLPAPFQLIVIVMICLNVICWLVLKLIKFIGVEKLCFFNFIYCFLGFLLFWEFCNLALPLFMIIDILPHWVLGIILVILYVIVILFFRIKTK